MCSSDLPPVATDNLLDPPPEWMCQGNFDRDTARSILDIAVKSLWPPARSYRHFPRSIGRIARWIVPAVFGDRIARGCAGVHVTWARARLLLANALGSESLLVSRFKEYIAALITVQRLAVIGKLRQIRRGSMRQGIVAAADRKSVV